MWKGDDSSVDNRFDFKVKVRHFGKISSLFESIHFWFSILFHLIWNAKVYTENR